MLLTNKYTVVKHGIALALALSSASVFAANCTQAPSSGGTYFIINKGANKALDVDTSDSGPTPNVITYNNWKPNNQKFIVTKQKDNYWKIKSAYNNKVVEVYNNSTSNGANVDTYEDLGSDTQRWELKHQSNGSFKIVNKLSSKSLTVASGEDAANVYQNDDANSSSQRWYFNPVNGTCGSDSNTPSPSDGPIGFAGQSGNDGLYTTTGGQGGPEVTVKTCDALVRELRTDGKRVINIPANTTIDCRTEPRPVQACRLDCAMWDDPGKLWYRIPVGDTSCKSLDSDTNQTFTVNRNETRILVTPNKSVIGGNKNSGIRGGTLVVYQAQNVIIKNLKIYDVNPALVEASSGIEVDDSSHVWIDHVSFKDISDGQIDFGNSKNVTVSWNHFKGLNPQVCANHHWYTNLVKNTEVTFHHNFWDEAAGRNPKLTGENTRAHIFNNYWKNITYYSISTSHGAQALVENNYFENARSPHWVNGGGYINVRGNKYVGSSASDPHRDTNGQVFQDVQAFPKPTQTADEVAGVISQVGPQ